METNIPREIYVSIRDMYPESEDLGLACRRVKEGTMFVPNTNGDEDVEDCKEVEVEVEVEVNEAAN